MKARYLPVLLLVLGLGAHAAVDAPRYAAGDTWSFQMVDGYNHEIRGTYTHTVSSVGSGGMLVELRAADGRLLDTVMMAAPGLLSAGRLNSRAGGRLEPALQLLPFPLEEGKRWRQSVVRLDPIEGQKHEVRIYGKVQGWETVKVPAGQFKALKIERELYLGDEDAFRGQTRLTEHLWYVPELKQLVKLQSWEEYHEHKYNVTGPYYQGDRATFELVSYRAGAS